MGNDTALPAESQLPASVTWADIDAETRSFRDGFIDAFRKYKGAEIVDDIGVQTGEKVTQAAFAARYGIPERTFERWLHDRGATNREHGAARHPNNRHNGGSPHHPDASPQERWDDELFAAQTRYELNKKDLDKRTAALDPLKKAERQHKLFEEARFRLHQRLERLVFETKVLPEKMAELKAIVDRGEDLPEPDPTITEGLEELPAEAGVLYGLFPWPLPPAIPPNEEEVAS
jgi:hypothetical protein